jgi:TonB family protein
MESLLNMMFASARVLVSFVFLAVPAIGLAQSGPSEPQVITAANTFRINVGPRKLEGHLFGTVRVGEDGKVKDVQVLEHTADAGFEQQLVKVLQSARFRPAIDAGGKPVEATIDMKVELRPSTGSVPKPVALKADPQLTEKEKARIAKMTCADFRWEWDILDDVADDAAATEFMPRIAIAMYVALRTQAGEYVDAKVWKASARALEDAAERCESNPTQLFFQDTFKPLLDQAVPR